MKRCLFAFLTLLILAASIGCNNTSLITNFSLISDSNAYDATAVTVAVDGAGWKHVAWSECDQPNHCRIVYAKFLFSRPTEFTYIVPVDFANTSYQDPDIAVTESGTAYLAWRTYFKNTTSYHDCYTRPAISTSCSVVAIEPIPKSDGRPRVAARGESVYLVYERIEAAGGTGLYYRQLNPLDRSKGTIGGAGAAYRNTDADLAISADGTLHVVYRAMMATPTNFYADNYGVTGDMVHTMQFTSGTLTAPKIACDDNLEMNGAKCYMAYGDTAPASDKMYLFYNVVGSPSVGGEPDVNLTGDQNWFLRGAPALDAVGSGSDSKAFLTFSAKNSLYPTISQVFGLTYHAGDSSPVPILRTYPAASYPNEKSSPLITAITGQHGTGLFTSGVTAWRNDASIPGAFFDAFIWDDSESVRQLDTTADDTYFGGLSPFDLAGNGTIAGGVWIEEYNTRTRTRRVPWVTSNRIPVFIPLVVR